MRGVVSAFGALVFAAAMSQPAAAQCYGPECERYRSGPPNYYGERPAQPSNSFHQPNSFDNGQPSRSAPYDQSRPYAPAPYPQPNYQRQSRPNYQPQPQPNYQQYSQPPVQQYPPQGYQQPAYQARPQSPAYSNAPPGMAPPPQGYRRAGPDGRIEVRTRVIKPPKGTKYTVRQHPPAPNGHGHRVGRDAAPPAGAGQITISVAEYRDLQNQARELQRLLSGRNGAPPANPANRQSIFPDAPPPSPGKPTRL